MDGDDFVGREHELAVPGRCRAAARAGDGGVVLAEGELGMGKTALAHELMRRARRDGMITCWGACLEGEGAPAYRPWTQILRNLGAATDKLLAPDADSRFRLFDEVADLLRGCRGCVGVLPGRGPPGSCAGDAVTVAEAATVVRGSTNDPLCDEIHALCRDASTMVRGADPVLEAGSSASSRSPPTVGRVAWSPVGSGAPMRTRFLPRL